MNDEEYNAHIFKLNQEQKEKDDLAEKQKELQKAERLFQYHKAEYERLKKQWEN